MLFAQLFTLISVFVLNWLRFHERFGCRELADRTFDTSCRCCLYDYFATSLFYIKPTAFPQEIWIQRVSRSHFRHLLQMLFVQFSQPIFFVLNRLRFHERFGYRELTDRTFDTSCRCCLYNYFATSLFYVKPTAFPREIWMMNISNLSDYLKTLKECSEFYNAAEDAKLKEFLGDASAIWIYSWNRKENHEALSETWVRGLIVTQKLAIC